MPRRFLRPDILSKLTLATFLIHQVLFAELAFSQLAFSKAEGSIFIPIEPCTVGDTRNTGSYSIPAGGTVEWLAHGDDLSGQGGGSCPQPMFWENPIAVAVTINAVASKATTKGNLKAYPADGEAGGATVLFVAGVNAGNSTILGLCNNGACDGKFKIDAIKEVPASATVTGYFYNNPKPERTVTVALSGGDYTSVDAALIDVDRWCPVRGHNNTCDVKVAPGLYYTPFSMISYVSVTGSGIDQTVIGWSQDGAIVNINDVQEATLSNMSIGNVGSVFGAASPVGILVDTTSGPTDVKLVGLDVRVSEGTTESTGIAVSDSGSQGGLVVIKDVTVTLSNGNPGNEFGLFIGQPNVFLDNVISVVSNGVAMQIADSTTMYQAIRRSTFYAATGLDVQATNVTGSILHSEFITNSIDFFGADINCAFVVGAGVELTQACSVP